MERLESSIELHRANRDLTPFKDVVPKEFVNAVQKIGDKEGRGAGVISVAPERQVDAVETDFAAFANEVVEAPGSVVFATERIHQGNPPTLICTYMHL